MATKYCDWELGNDATGDGTAGNPYQTLTKASTEAGEGGNVRVGGRAGINLGNATWTHGSATVTFASSQSLNVGDLIGPADVERGGWYEVTGGSGATWTIHTKYWLATDEATPTYLLAPVVPTAADTIEKGVTVSFGWDLETETQPDYWYTCWRWNHGASPVLDMKSTNTILEANGKLILCAHDATYEWQTVIVNAGRVTGLLTALLDRYQSVLGGGEAADIVLITARHGHGYLSHPGSPYYVGRADLRGATSNNAALIHGTMIGELWLRASNLSASGMYATGVIDIGQLHMHDLSTVRMGGADCLIRVGEMDNQDGATILLNGRLEIGAPVAEWIIRDVYGIADRTTGRGDAGYCIRINPSVKRQTHFLVPIHSLVESGKTVQIRFYAYYSGTAADVPSCYVVPHGSCGLDTTAKVFSPPHGSSWADATQQSITFDGTSNRNSSAEFLIGVCDNNAGDAVVYIDDIEVVQS